MGRRSRQWGGIATSMTESDSLFRPGASSSKVTSPLKKGEAVEVQRMAPEDACENDMLVLIRGQGRKLAVPLSQLIAVDADESSVEAIGDWHYWVAQGYCF